MDRRTLLAISLSFALLVVYQWFLTVYGPQPTPEQTVSASSNNASSTPQAIGSAATKPIAAVDEALKQAQTAMDSSSKIHFATNVVEGQIALTGSRLIDLRFLKHTQNLLPGGKPGEPVHFLSTEGSSLFFQEGGFLAGSDVVTPSRTTVWNVVGSPELQGAGQLHLAWNNGQGVTFEKIYTFENESYLIKVEDRVLNRSGKPITVHPYNNLVRVQPPANKEAIGIVDFEGPMAFLDGKRFDHAYEDLLKAEQTHQALAGWAGFSDKYFLASMVPVDTVLQKKFYFQYDAPAFRTGFVAPGVEVKGGEQYSANVQLFIGPKEYRTLKSYDFHINRSIDYGWFHFLAAPLVEVLLFFQDYVHNFGVAIILLTLIIKLIFYPLANKSYRSMHEMKLLAPKIEQIKKLYSADRQRMNQEVMRLYQEHKVNPLGGCLPIVIQIPVFFALYKVLLLTVEIRHAPFVGWIYDLSDYDPYYVLPLLMGASMYIQTKLNPAPPDPMQAKVMLFLPVIFTFMFLNFPSGLVLYWLLNNVLSIGQQAYITRQKIL